MTNKRDWHAPLDGAGDSLSDMIAESERMRDHAMAHKLCIAQQALRDAAAMCLPSQSPPVYLEGEEDRHRRPYR
jgi:hypothetical protein